MSIEIPPQFDTSIKIEETAKGVRVHVHVYGNGRRATVDEAWDTYLYATGKKREEIILAPIEVKS